MCDGIKNIVLLKQQLETALKNDIEIIQIEFVSGKLKYRDRWSVKKILDEEEARQQGKG